MYQTFTNPQGKRVPVMRKTLSALARGGVTFGNYYVSDSLCGPSRATYLTGQYAHNNGIEGNNDETTSEGGYPNFIRSPAAHQNLAVWLQRAGYRTIHIGKFLNRFGEPPYGNPTEVPPGWSSGIRLSAKPQTIISTATSSITTAKFKARSETLTTNPRTRSPAPTTHRQKAVAALIRPTSSPSAPKNRSMPQPSSPSPFTWRLTTSHPTATNIHRLDPSPHPATTGHWPRCGFHAAQLQRSQRLR